MGGSVLTATGPLPRCAARILRKQPVALHGPFIIHIWPWCVRLPSTSALDTRLGAPHGAVMCAENWCQHCCRQRLECAQAYSCNPEATALPWCGGLRFCRSGPIMRKLQLGGQSRLKTSDVSCFGSPLPELLWLTTVMAAALVLPSLRMPARSADPRRMTGWSEASCGDKWDIFG